jgi:hypothetical protein
VDVIFVNGNAGNGRINLANAEIRSSAFKAEATGDISIAPVLTNSTLNIPLTIYLSRSLAEKIGQVTAETPTNAAYVALPDFVTLTGTVGVPKPKTDPLALVRIAGRAGGGIFNRIGEAGGQTGSSILNRGARVFEGLTGGSRTNQPSETQTNQTPGSFFDRLLRPGTNQ